MRNKLIIVSVLLASCGSVSRLPSFTPHKIEIRQGNLVLSEMRAKLRLGMSRSQVKAALGTPLVSDALHANRWDYVYRLEQDSKLIEQQRMTVYFDGDVLTRIDDGTMPPLPASSALADPIPVVAEPVPAESVPDVPSIAPLAAEQAIESVVLGWAAAWSARDADKYIAGYAPEFKPANGLSRDAWEAQRRGRITGAKTIEVELTDIKVSMRSENKASVSFKQTYRADSYRGVTRKMLEMEKFGDAWLIVSEQVAGK